MSASDVLHPDGTDYDAFLFAKLGEDSAGDDVTVLSALAVAANLPSLLIAVAVTGMV